MPIIRDMETAVSARERLAEWIERGKINQVEAARLIGIDKTQLSQILSGKRTPGLANAIKIEQATGIQPADWMPTDDAESAETVSVTTKRGRISKS